MGRIQPQVRFVRQFDLRTWDLRETIRVNPRTRFASTRAGLSWTGTREYNTPDGVLRVLRRPVQVESAAHLKTLRRLPTPPGHPSGDRDVDPTNVSELLAGYTGDDISIETVDGFARPVADITVVRPDVFAEMMTIDQWQAYAATYPEQAAGVNRGNGPAKTGTSLGYSALWVSPMVEAEIVEDNEGALVGSWLGPDGKSYRYDTEHIVDADCELVQQLKVDEDFDPSELGGQHFAIRLDAMNGRGGLQSELLRVVDSRMVWDPTRARVQAQVPRATANPKSEHAQAQESTDAAPKKTDPMTTQKVVISVRDAGVADFLKSKGIALTSTSVVLDMAPAEQVEAAIADLMERLGALVQMVKTGEADGEEMATKMGEQGEELEAAKSAAADMPDADELKKQIAELEGKLAASKEELAKVGKAGDDAKTVSDDKIAGLNEQLAPYYAAKLAEKRVEFVALGLDEKDAESCASEADLRRKFIVGLGLAHYADENDKTDAQVEVCFEGYAARAPAKVADKGAEYKPGVGLKLLPQPKINKPAKKTADAKTPETPAPTSNTAALLAASLD